jgi:hypothetical protein
VTEFDHALSVFADPNFAVQVSFQHALTAPVTLNAVEGRPQRLEGWEPNFRVFGFNGADFSVEPVKGDHITVGSTVYSVFKVHRETDGWVYLALN